MITSGFKINKCDKRAYVKEKKMNMSFYVYILMTNSLLGVIMT